MTGDGMESQGASLVVGAAVGAACRYLVGAGLQGVGASVAGAIISALLVAVYGYSAGDISRTTAWSYVLLYLNVLGVASGAFHFSGHAIKKLKEGESTPPSLFIVLAIGLSFLASSGCALTSSHPTAPQQAALHARVVSLVDAFTIAAGIVDEAGYIVNDSPLSTADKDAVDCLIEKATGNDAPSATQLRICGPIPSRADSKLRVALRTLKDLTTEASLQQTIRVVLEVLEPLWQKLKASGNARLATLGVILELALRPAAQSLSSGGL